MTDGYTDAGEFFGIDVQGPSLVEKENLGVSQIKLLKISTWDILYHPLLYFTNFQEDIW